VLLFCDLTAKTPVKSQSRSTL